MTKARIAVIGAGWWATEFHLPSLAQRSDRAEIIGVSREGAEELALVKERFEIPVASEDWRKVIAEIRPDGVIVASPHVAHYENAAAALDAGAHVLVEKPMTVTGEQARDLVARAARAGRQIMIPHGYNFTDYTRAAADLVHAGRLGEARHGIVQMGSALLDLFGGQPMLETRDHTFRPPASTWADPKRAGGYGWGQLSHALGMLYRILPLAPAEIYARTGTSPTGADYFDAAVLTLENGATITLSGSAAVPKHLMTHIDLRLYGSEGCLFLDVERERMALHRLDRDDHVHWFPPGSGTPRYSTDTAVGRFVDLCRGETIVNDADGDVGLRTVLTLEAMYRSAAEGRAVSI